MGVATEFCLRYRNRPPEDPNLFQEPTMPTPDHDDPSIPFNLEQEASQSPPDGSPSPTLTWSQEVETEAQNQPILVLARPLTREEIKLLSAASWPGRLMVSPPSVTLDAPWPPLSREQVVELHEALVRFSGHMEAASEMGDEDGMGREALAAGWLWEVVRRLHIGAPPAPPQSEPAPVRHNCWSCSHADGTACGLFGSMRSEALKWWWAETEKLPQSSTSPPTMPSPEADGCPGWEVKP